MTTNLLDCMGIFIKITERFSKGRVEVNIPTCNAVSHDLADILEIFADHLIMMTETDVTSITPALHPSPSHESLTSYKQPITTADAPRPDKIHPMC